MNRDICDSVNSKNKEKKLIICHPKPDDTNTRGSFPLYPGYQGLGDGLASS